MPKKQEIQKSQALPCLKSFIDLVNKNMLSRPHCKFCQSKHRKEAEEYYEHTRQNIRATRKFLSDKGDDISYRGVRNHLQHHYIDESRIEGLSNYANDLSAWIGRHTQLRDRLIERIGILDKEIITIAALSNSESLEEKRKSAVVVQRLSDSITSLEREVASLDKVAEPTEILIEKLRDIIAIKVQSAQSEDTKVVLIDVIDELSEQVSGLLIADND